MSIQKKHIVVALSGGVDSAVAAALLKNPRYKITGVFMRFWSEEIAGKQCGNSCCPHAALCDAEKIARQLGIDFTTVDLREIFYETVVRNYIAEQNAGRTPSPCVLCNAEIRLGKFLEWARTELRADAVATGHYARVSRQTGHLVLKQPRDLQKDQTYFLYRLSSAQLANIIFPLGDLTKPQVRAYARQLNLVVSSKKDSQDLCWMNGDQSGFMDRNLSTTPGDIINTANKVLGQHKGLPYYTLGQRAGLGLATGGGPYYVARKDSKTNCLMVTTDPNDPLLSRDNFTVNKCVYNVPWEVWPRRQLKVRLRSGSKLIDCNMPDKYQCELATPERAVTPGQSAVFYHGGRVLGGGIIA